MQYFALLLCILLPVAGLYGQATLGASSLSGVIRDASGLPAPAAAVVLTDVERGLTRQTSSNDTGNFFFPSIPPGEYSLMVTKAGFKAQEIRNLKLTVGQADALDISLTVGEVSSVVEVKAEPAQLETESNVIGTLIDSGRVQDLPLNGRNYLQLALLSGGAVPATGRSDAIAGQTGRAANAVLLGGNVGSSTGYLIDGIAVRGGRLGESALNLSPAVIDQFKVQMSFFMPDQGPNPGLINLTTKAGSNKFHGEVFEFFRNGDLDARNFFSPGSENLHRNQFGAALGGPIRRDRTWFFVNFESLRELTAFTSSGYSPTAAMFGGDFSALAATIYDPQTYSSTTGLRSPFAGNVIPVSRINSVSKALLPYYLPGSSLSQKPSNLFTNPRKTSDDDQYGARLDHAFSSNQNIFFRYLRETGNVVSPGLMPYSGSQFPLQTDYATVQHTWTIRPTLVNNIRAGFVRNEVFSANEGAALGNILPTLGITNTLDGHGITGVSVSGYAGFGRSAGSVGNIDNSYQLDDTMFWTHGTHAVQFGMSLRYRRTWQQNANANALGSLAFQPQFTAQLTKNAQGTLSPQAGSGDSFADFLLGAPATGQMVGLPLLPYRFTQWNPYIQDTWKVSRTFTINAGIAWFVATPPNPVNWAAKLPHGFDYLTGLLQYAALGQVNPEILTTNWHNFTPRLGFSWQPAFLKNTVIRAGAGTYFTDSKLIEAQFAMVAPPFNTPQTIVNTPSNPVPVYVLGQNIFPPAPSIPLNESYASNLPAGTTAFLLKPSNSTPYSNQWNFSIQHSLSSADLIEVVYLGMSAHDLQNRYEGDQCLVTPALFCNQVTKPYARYASLYTADFNGNSSYEALIARYVHNSVGGLSSRLEYTYGKALNDSFEGGSNESQIASCRRCDKGPASFDIKHRVVASLIYHVPFGRGLKYGANTPAVVNFIAGGWSATTIATFATGAPFDVTGANTTGYSNITHRANRICDGRSDALSGNVRTDGLKWFDTTCFSAPLSGFYGSASRNVLYGPGVNNWDIGFEKLFPIPLREGMNIQFRGELFNAFNHAQFGAPNSLVTSPVFGLISSANSPRLVQFALRLVF